MKTIDKKQHKKFRKQRKNARGKQWVAAQVRGNYDCWSNCTISSVHLLCLSVFVQGGKMKYLAWVGQNATWGTPHPVTGRYSMFGDLHAFETKKERDQFCDEWNHRHNTYPVPTNRKEAKARYFAGVSQATFNEIVDGLLNDY